MNIYPEGYVVSTVVPFTDLNGAEITVTGVTARLLDENDSLVNDFGAITFVALDGQVEIVISALMNTLGVGKTSGGRTLRISLTTADGVVKKNTAYLLKSDTEITVMENSFMTLSRAELLASSSVNMSGWNMASTAQKELALISAFGRISKVPLRFNPTEDSTEETIILAGSWQYIDKAEFDLWPEFFTNKIFMAQLAEANEILQGDEIGKRHRSGIISETIGEASIMLRGGRLDLGISRSALDWLVGHIYYSFRSART